MSRAGERHGGGRGGGRGSGPVDAQNIRTERGPRMTKSPDAHLTTAIGLSLVLPAALLMGAFGSELMSLVPCEMCWWQRWAHMCALPFAIAAMLFLTPPLRRTTLATTRRADRVAALCGAGAGMAILASGVIGAYHAGVEYHWWQGRTACASSLPRGLSTAEFLEVLMAKPLVRCDSAQWTLFGISLAGYNAVMSIGAAAIIAWELVSWSRRR